MATFIVRNSSNDADPRKHIAIKRNDEEIVIAKFYSLSSKEAYNVGLEEGHKPVVNFEDVAQALATTLDMYHRLNRLNDESYHVIMDVYRPVLKQRIKYERIAEFLNGPGKGDWAW